MTVTPLAHGTEALAWLQARGVRRLQCDSRQVEPGDAFVAWPGWAQDGRRHVPSALGRGAVACLVDAHGLAPLQAEWQQAAVPVADGALASLPNLKAHTGELAAAFHGHPSRQLDVVAVTGTNGKTTTTWWLAQALSALRRPCGVVGTLGMGLPNASDAQAAPLAGPGGLVPTGLTTPDPIRLQATLQHWVHSGVKACAIEASSIGLAEHRLAGLEVAVAVFTNFTQDHLDYHGDMNRYWAVKRRLFEWPGLRAAVVHVDDPMGQRLAQELALDGTLAVWTTSLSPDAGATLVATGLTPTASGQWLTVHERGTPDGSGHALNLPFVGRYNAANLLGVVGALRALGHSLADAVDACRRLTAVPGRMEPVGTPPAADDQPLVLIDYAHTPDALQQALLALRPVAQTRGGALHVVFGCGGDRDPHKRPLMAAAAEAMADQLWLTSDNPRSESPHAILAQVAAGLRRPQAARLEADRAQAIAAAVAAAAAADVVLVAGKGHETTQEIAGVHHPFSDRAHAQAALARRPLKAVA